jgi:hypothetical protein
MASIFAKPSLLVTTAVKQLQRTIVLPPLVWTNAVSDFGGSQNDTINVRIPAISTSTTRTFRGTGSDRLLTASDLQEHTFPVTLDNIIYHAVNLTDEQLTLDVVDWIEQVLMVQVSACAYGLENYVGAMISGAPYTKTFWIDPADTFPTFVDARRALNDKNVPDTDRVMVVGSAVEAALLKDRQFRHFEQSGDQANDALRQATLMNIAGLPVVRSNQVAPDVAYIFHKTAFILANRAPVKPQSIVAGASYAAAGQAWRWFADYDSINLQERSIIDTYVGHKVVTEIDGSFVRAVQLRLKPTAVTVATPAVSLTAAAGPVHTFQLTVLDNNGVDVTLLSTFVSATTAKATVAAGPGAGAGLVTAVAAGTSVITATYVSPADGSSITGNVTVTVV